MEIDLAVKDAQSRRLNLGDLPADDFAGEPEVGLREQRAMLEIRRAFTGESLMSWDQPTMEGARLREANLRGADLTEINMSGADLTGAMLRAAEMNQTNLEGANLEGANLMLANLRRANLRGANLKTTILEGAALFRTDLRGANLQGANMFGTLLTQAIYDYTTQWPAGIDPQKLGAQLVTDGGDAVGPQLMDKVVCASCGNEIFKDALKCRHCGEWLNRATEKDASGQFLNILGPGGEVLCLVPAKTLEGADLTKANLHCANLANCNLRKANMSGVDVTRAQLTKANLENAQFATANLSGANMREANLTGATLTNATMKGTSLEGAVLVKADLNGANLKEANLSKVDLRGADFFGANLFGVNLSEAIYDESTVWPVGFNPVKAGAPVLPGKAPAPSASPKDVPAPSQSVSGEFSTGAVSSPKITTQRVNKIKCPFCAEEILSDAIKCRFCGEWLKPEESPTPLPQTNTVHKSPVALYVMIGVFGSAMLVLALVMMLRSGGAATASGEKKGGLFGIGEKPAAIGAIEAREIGSEDSNEWWNMGEFGRIELPSGKEYRLTIYPAVTDLSAMDKVGADEIHTLDLMSASIDDSQLKHLEKLTGLKELLLPPQTTDEGLKHLAPLTQLEFLFLLDTRVTDAGLEQLKSMTSLQDIYLPKGIGEAAMADLQAALPNTHVSKY